MVEMRNDAASPFWVGLAGLSGALSVIAGAFAAHGLDKATDANAIEWLHTGSLYAALHALAMLATAALAAVGRLDRRTAAWAQRFFVAGGVLFPGALYGLALGAPRWFGAIAPIGGTAFILGWIALSIAGFTYRPATGKKTS